MEVGGVDSGTGEAEGCFAVEVGVVDNVKEDEDTMRSCEALGMAIRSIVGTCKGKGREAK